MRPQKSKTNYSLIYCSSLPFFFYSFSERKSIPSGPIVPSLFKMEPPHQIIIDTVKLAEDDHGEGKQVILRLYEAYGGKSNAVLSRYAKKQKTFLLFEVIIYYFILNSHFDIKRIQVSNILEDDLGTELQRRQHGFAVTLRAFQIMTLKIDLK